MNNLKFILPLALGLLLTACTDIRLEVPYVHVEDYPFHFIVLTNPNAKVYYSEGNQGIYILAGKLWGVDNDIVGEGILITPQNQYLGFSIQEFLDKQHAKGNHDFDCPPIEEAAKRQTKYLQKHGITVGNGVRFID